MDAGNGLLLHICCAPCGGGCVDRPEMIDPARPLALCYSNSNLDTLEEFERRLRPVEFLARHYQLELIVDDYDHDAWLEAVAGLEDEPECGRRCRKCFEFNLKRTAQLAEKRGENFATTLTVSPRKSSAVIFETGGAFPGFEAIDFKKKNGYLIGRNFALEHGFYRQNYCGCEFSRRCAGTIEGKKE